MNTVFEHWDFSLIGNAHLSSNKVKQDYSYSKITKTKAVAIVADGHGGAKYIRSDRGAEIAVHGAAHALADFVRNVSAEDMRCEVQRSKLLRQLTDGIVYHWKETVLSDFIEHPLTKSERKTLAHNDDSISWESPQIEQLYGTTLLAFVIAKEYALGIQIGDGKMFAIDHKGHLSQVIADDERCFLNATTSLSDVNAYEEFRYCYYGDEMPACVFAATDGIDRLYGEGEMLHHFYQRIYVALASNEKTDCVNELLELLRNLSPSSDDMSIACLYDKRAIADNPLVVKELKKSNPQIV